MKAVDQLAASRRISKTSIIEDALTKFFETDADDEKALRNELLRIERKIRAIGLDVSALGEVLGAYVFNWFCHLTPIPESERQAAKALGQKRLSNFIEQVRLRRISEESLWQLISDNELQTETVSSVEDSTEAANRSS